MVKDYGISVLHSRTIDGDTPLIYLSRIANWQDAQWRRSLSRRVQVAKFLIENRAKVDVQNKWGNTAFHYAVYPAHQAALGILLLQNSEGSALCDIPNGIGITPLTCSTEAREKDTSLVEALMNVTGLTSSSWARSASSRDLDSQTSPYF